MGRARIQTRQSSSSIYVLDHDPMLNYNVSFSPTVTHKDIYIGLPTLKINKMKSKEDRKYLQSQIWLSGNAQLHTQVHQTPLNVILYACALEFNTTTSGRLLWELIKTTMCFINANILY